jgi:site-specific DNA-methyltransferase (adenine-specific)
MTPYFAQDGVTLYHGDNVQTMREAIPDASIDLVVTSPPYDNLRTYGGHTWDFEGVAAQLWRVIKPGGVVVWIVNDATVDGSETGTSFRQVLHFMEIGFRLNDTMIWDKGGFSAVGSCQVRYGPVYEFMFVLTKGPATAFNPLKDRKNSCVGADPRTSSVRETNGQKRRQESLGAVVGEFGIRFNIWRITPESNSVHAAIFPEALARDHILSWSNEGDTVLDPFSGSGTTLKMARLMGRTGIGIEIHQDYCDIAVERLRQKLLF